MANRIFASWLLIFFCADAPAQTVDLVIHNGFEDCWSQALTKPAFLALLQNSLDGQTTCVPPISGTQTGINYTACYTAACPGGATGCPVTVHPGVFSGDFGTGDFSASGTADNVTVTVEYSGLPSGTCTISISNITETYAPSFYETPDGNSGDYMAYLTPASGFSLNNRSYSSADPICSALISSAGTQVDNAIHAQAASQMMTALSASAAGESVCPLTP